MQLNHCYQDPTELMSKKTQPQPDEVLSRQVPVGADELPSDELLLQRRERVSLQHVQPVQQLQEKSAGI